MFRSKMRKILILLSCLIFIVGLISTIVRGQDKENPISSIQVDIHQEKTTKILNVRVKLVDNNGKPILDKSYGDPNAEGTWFIDNIRSIDGKDVEFEVLDDKELGKGIYQGTLQINLPIDNFNSNKFILCLVYNGDSINSEKVATSNYEFSIEKEDKVSKSVLQEPNNPPIVNLVNIDPNKVYYVNSLIAGTTLSLNGKYKVFNRGIEVIQTSLDGVRWQNAIINRKSRTWSSTIILPSKEGEFTLYYRGKDKSGQYSLSEKGLNIIIDKTPPRISKLSGSIDYSGKVKGIRLNWSEVKDNLSGIDHYLLYRNNKLIRPFYLDNLRSNIDGYFYDNNAIDKISDIDINNPISPNISVEYKLCAVDKAGNISSFSKPVKILYTPQRSKSVSSLNVLKAASFAYYPVTPSFISPHGDYETGFRTSYCSACHNTHSSEDIHLVKERESYLCLECHNGNGSNYIVSGYLNGSAHYDANHENGYSCRTCHNSHGNSNKYFLPYDTSNKLCLSCHDGSSHGDNIQSDLSEKYSHRSPSCTACHNTHMAKTSAPLNGVSGVSVNRIDNTFTYKSSISEEYELCYKCHSEYTKLVDREDVISSENVAIDFDPSNGSYHAVEGIPKAEFVTDSTFRGIDSQGKPWNYYSKVKCTDCHGNAAAYPEEPRIQGIHGSSNIHILKGWYDVSKTWTDITKDIDGFLCFRCHNPEEYITNINADRHIGSNFRMGTSNLHNSGKHNFPCWQCHGENIHGQKGKNLIPIKNVDSSSKITEFIHADGGTYTKNSCSTNNISCHNS